MCRHGRPVSHLSHVSLDSGNVGVGVGAAGAQGPGPGVQGGSWWCVMGYFRGEQRNGPSQSLEQAHFRGIHCRPNPQTANQLVFFNTVPATKSRIVLLPLPLDRTYLLFIFSFRISFSPAWKDTQTLERLLFFAAKQPGCRGYVQYRTLVVDRTYPRAEVSRLD